MSDSDFKAEIINIDYKNNFVNVRVIIPKSFIETLQKYGLIKTPLNKQNENKLLKEIYEKIKGDKTIYKSIKNEIDNANKILYLYNPENQTIKYDLYLVNIGNESVDLLFRVTFTNSNISKNKYVNKPNNITNNE
jgi:Mg2+ and Co2+ transporter CorA